MSSSLAPDDRPDDVEQPFRADPDAAPGDGFEVPGIPASAPILRDLRRDLETAASAAAPGSRVAELLEEVLRGRAELSSLLAADGIPLPDLRRLPADFREIVDAAAGRPGSREDEG